MATNNHGKVYINRHGEEVMRITEVIKTLAKDSLILWANMLGFKKVSYRKELERTANIGSLVHAYLEDFSNMRTITSGDVSMDFLYQYDISSYGDQYEARNAILSFQRWYNKNANKFHPVFTEKVVVGDHVGGTIDLGLQGIHDKSKVILGDYKTSKDVYLTMYLQLAGYVTIYEEVYGKNTVEGVVVLQLDKASGEEANVLFLPRESLDVFMDMFSHLLEVAMRSRRLSQTYRHSLIELSDW